MADKRYHIPEEGTSDWHLPLNENFEALETDVEIRDEEANLNNYDPQDGAKFLATDTGVVYLGNGSSWSQVFDLSDGGSNSNHTSVEGINLTGRHVGPLPQGGYFDGDGPDDDDPRFGIVFWAEAELDIQTVVVDSDLSEVNTNTIEVQLTEYGDGVENPTVIDSRSVTLSGGPERINLDFTIPSDGEYILVRDFASTGDDIVPLRRVTDWDGWDDWTRDDIDLIGGTYLGTTGDWGAENNYYFFFDLEIGPDVDRVTSPWSTDVDEIYMRPRDPEEEFDNISPRALWIDTSDT